MANTNRQHKDSETFVFGGMIAIIILTTKMLLSSCMGTY